MQWVILGIFLLITVTLLSGRGSWLIAGYNTMSKEQQARYDRKKLCKTVGIMMLFIDAVLLITFVIMETELGAKYESLIGFSALALMLAILVSGMVVTNRRVKNKNE